ncbi:glycoside hydrolase family 16 protein [Lacisediminimonas sp.]|uniref:glycoside hydrolase family 16 protein n=1 Tax=Lacisediminimonas sp. TaxID=3060582 RepID=UPI002724AF0F|nr:glycoside hydrolase family 16 protein [Lacisediminimonas sp.]MDO8299451.1 glycoside hydrolase family 16 protein [Lacisediminimonas sp.]
MFNQTQKLPALRAVSCAAMTMILLASCGGGGSETGSDVAASALASESNIETKKKSTTTTTPPADTTTPPADTTTPPADTTTPPATTTPPPVTTTPVVSDPAPYGQTATAYTLSFADEFTSGLNSNLWNDHIWYESSNATKNYTVENGALKIWPQRDASGNFFNRTIDTDGKYYQTYGYFEIEAKLPIGKGTWPAFWLFNHIDSRRPEIDIMEAYAGGGPNSGWSDANLHPTAYGATIWLDASVNGGYKMIQTPDLSAGFHKYGLKWEANKQTFYFDGKEVFSANVTMGDPMYLMLDLWYGSASGQPDSTTPTGKTNSYEVNYVRAWKFK